MYLRKIVCLLTVLGALVCLVGAAGAAQVDCDSVYCFSAEEFSEQGEITGICITRLPEDPGALMLGERVLLPGDILTAGQVAQMTYHPQLSETDRSIQVGYLPIYADSVGADAVMTLSIRGKEDKAPVAEDFALETYKNLPISAPLKAEDPEGQPLSYQVVRQPKRGSLQIGEDGTFVYTPRKNKVGVDSFVFTATDPAGKVSREATVTITILKVTDSTQYTDTVGHSCRFAAEWMKNTGIFVGEQLDGNACFRPEQTVTRGEFVTMVVRALDLLEQDTADYTGYSDEIPQWLRPYVAAAVRSGLTAGLPEQQTFGAEEPITGAEAAVMLNNALDLSTQTAETFAGEDVPAWAVQAVSAMQENGMTLDAAGYLTRAQAAQLLYEVSCRLTQRTEHRTLTQ